MGIGQLQKHAGPDTGISSQAALSHTNINPYWTAIWNSIDLHNVARVAGYRYTERELANCSPLDLEILTAKQVNFQSEHTVTVRVAKLSADSL